MLGAEPECRADGVGEEVHLSHPNKCNRLEGTPGPKLWTDLRSSDGGSQLTGTCCGRRYLSRCQMSVSLSFGFLSPVGSAECGHP